MTLMLSPLKEATMNPNQPPSSSNSSTLAPSASRPNAGSQDVRAKAGEAVAKLAEVAQQAGSQAKQTASSLASDANKKTKGYLNQQVSAGADLAGHVAESRQKVLTKTLRSWPSLCAAPPTRWKPFPRTCAASRST